MITADVTPALQAEVEALRSELEEVVILNQLQESAAETLTNGLEGAQTARSSLSEAISERTDLPRRFEEDPIQTALLIASAETLEAFASGLTDAFSVENNVAYSTNVKGSLSLPMQGNIIRGFNAQGADGVTRPGLSIAGRPRALVTSPTPATILFVGPLLDYGNIVILEPAPNVLFVLAGLAEIYGIAGQVVPEAFPIGLLGGEQPEVDAILTESDRGAGNVSTQTLDLEVREGQTPVDPTTWFVLD
jgi:septal ring factor EnvC (AmiA/AmiB activator)